MHSHSHSHGHSHGGHGHHHGLQSGTRAFAVVTLINLAYTALEAGYGFWTNSLALLSDALHNLGDVLGLGLAWGAAVLAQRLPTDRHTYGWRRATLLSPLANALLVVGFSGALAWEAIRRFDAPPQIPALPVILVAALGIAVNLGAAWMVRDGHDHDLNRRGAFLHLMADAAVSLAAVLAGAGMWLTGWEWLDPAIALLIGAVVAAGAFGLLRESFNAAMDAVPSNIDRGEVEALLLAQPGVLAVHHVHIWSLGAGEIAMTAHIVRPDDRDHDVFIDTLNRELDRRFNINHPTLQVEHGGACEHDRHDRAPHGHAARAHGGHDHGHAGHDHDHDHEGHDHGHDHGGHDHDHDKQHACAGHDHAGHAHSHDDEADRLAQARERERERHDHPRQHSHDPRG
ncbi:cation diffusion facilitator family transporter [Lysobacter enzymogenes]|uniref:cation diffusion facilitator family transporter n=1 Tax=Lysobacter enzymogenes TaxID=69 RepID=UPI00089B2282|nr:cation diffusion facilitator family transporter [Lysobacter enzymogenes]SDX03447.1 cobalt-zinc-cadmium efflux system protein [Lysobacter enzymogenes]